MINEKYSLATSDEDCLLSSVTDFKEISSTTTIGGKLAPVLYFY